MDIEYKELSTSEEFNQCIELQRSIFGLSDTDLISPLFLKLISRNNPPIGISLGLFSNSPIKNELIGFIIGFATFIENSIHATLMGIKNEYQKKGYGYKLYLKFREASLEKNIDCMYGIFDPIESHLASLYFTNLGFTGIKYEEEADANSNNIVNQFIPEDKLLIRWDFKSESTLNKLSINENSHIQKINDNIPIVNRDYLPDLSKVFVEIPNNFIQLSKNNFEEALHWRMSTRTIFSEYINTRNYIVTDCYSINQENKRKIYYLLEKQ